MRHVPTRHIELVGALAVAALVTGSAIVLVNAGADTGAGRVQITILSTDASRVTGGDVLVQVSVPAATPLPSVHVSVDGRDVTSVFHPEANVHALMGLVTGLKNGTSTLAVASHGAGEPAASLELTNYPITGPVFSGPWITPFICQTNAFKLPDGSTLGAPLDDNCSAKTVVQYVYRTTDGTPTFRPLPLGAAAPADMAKTTTTDGKTVPFIVRVETGTMDRGIYQNTILFDPATDPPPTPMTPPKGWNRRLIAIHGSGCPGGWYIQGPVMGVNPLDADRLGQGYALFINTLNHPTNSCNAVVAGEATMMGKEHFIEEFGVPFYTMSTGNSGGAYTSLQVADAFPGLIDGVNIGATFPDALDIAMSGTDAHLLAHYFMSTTPLTDEQKVAISGYSGMRAFIDAANQAQRTDPVPDRADAQGYQSARWHVSNAVADAMKYEPVKNPRGARPTIFDVARNIYGVNPRTGAALRTFDNVGVQYGLSALNRGAIAPAAFLALNETIGGGDEDLNYTATRAVGDAGAIARAYQSGLLLSGKGGLASIPVFDNGTTNELGGYHYGWFHFAVRDRLREANGHSDNMVIWRNTTPAAAQAVFDKWMVAYMSDSSKQSPLTKALRNKPKEAVEGCYDKATPPGFIPEHLVFTSKPTTKCSEMFPVYSNVRHEAGGPLSANVLKCQLKPVEPGDYKVALSASEMARLKTIFPSGVCDWSKPGVNQGPVATWASWGPNPKNRVFDVTKP